MLSDFGSGGRSLLFDPSEKYVSGCPDRAHVALRPDAGNLYASFTTLDYAGDAAACAAIEGRLERALRMEAALAEALRPLADRGEASHPADVARQALADGAPAAHVGAERHAAGK